MVREELKYPQAGTNYGRIQILASNGWQGPSGANREFSNISDLTFGVPTANWGTIAGAGLYDASTAGNLYFVSYLTTPKTVNNRRWSSEDSGWSVESNSRDLLMIYYILLIKIIK
jgi:hypothetical protein